MNIEGSFDWRYNDTLRINFDGPIGLGSCSIPDTKDELEFEDQFGTTDPSILVEYVDLAIMKFFKNDVSIDWSDAYEVEIHGVLDHNFDENDLIDIINSILDINFD